MTTPPQTPLSSPHAVRVGALAPLTPPGWVDAGRHLLAGMELAVDEVNSSGGIGGRPLELLVRDTAADPLRAEAAVRELADLGVAAVAGEYHSVVARAAAARAEEVGVPFLCSSAVLDALTDAPARWVARLAPPQSRGWRIFADFLLAEGHRRIAVATQPSVYWATGTGILRDHVTPRGGSVVELAANASTPAALCDALAADGATALLLLVGTPDPAVPIVKAVRADPRLSHVLIGAPAGQPEFPGWASALGADGAGIPFLRYLPEHSSPLAERVTEQLATLLGELPSFVAYEGWDTITALAESLRTQGRVSWPHLKAEGTRGPITFTRTPNIPVAQWTWPPIQVTDRCPTTLTTFRTRYTP
ncbi:ABC transporter substrate-binding protein [Streptomyces sp. NPDC052225]|uniref:ABC transporter substrate-binding protein n=1 Tax=Streptomyces sp. NPDC052225 TaxID=3154949 RepID=UPI003425A6D4